MTEHVEHPPPLAAAPTPVAVREVLGFCPRLLSALPAPCTLLCSVRVGPAPDARVVITTAQAVYAASSRSWPTFTGAELAAMALAAEHDRASPAALNAWCRRKADEGSTWRLTAAVALGSVAGTFAPRGYTIGRVLEWYGLELRAIGIGDELPLPPMAAGEVAHAAE